MDAHIRTHLSKEIVRALAIVTIALLLMLSFRSISLDDFDSYSFALALDDYNLALQQPQPPGFPIYIAAARVLYALRPDAVFVLTLLSALCGAAATWTVWRIGQFLDPQHPATASSAALLFATLPVSWLTSGKALSDIPGMFATLFSLWLWLRWRGSDTAAPPYAAAAATGLSLGVRPQNALPIALLVGCYILQDLVSALQARPYAPGHGQRIPLTGWMKAAGAGLLGVLIWLIPTAQHSGGGRAYLALIGTHASHVGQADALFGMDAPLWRALRIRLIAFADTGLLSLTGVGAYPPQPPGTVARHLTWGLVIAIGILRADWRRWQTRALGIWWLATALQVLLFETLDRPRLLLPLAPPLTLLLAAGWARTVQSLPRRHLLRAGVLGGIILAMLVQTLPLVAQLSRTPAPPSQATAHIQAHYPSDHTLIAAAGSFRAAQVALGTYPIVYLYTFDPLATAERLAQEITHVAILDRDQFTPEAVAILSQEGALVTLEDRVFTRDRRVHTQHDQVRLQVLTLPELIPPEALRLPESGCLDLGGPDDGRYVGEGWFRAEDVGGTMARWAGGEITSTLRLTFDPAPDLTLYLRALAYPPQQTVTVMIDDQVLGNVSLSDAWQEKDLPLPSDLGQPGAVMTVRLIHQALASPFEVSAGASSDRRPLAAAYDWICISPSQPETP